MAISPKKALLFDSTRCIGCGACYVACKQVNRLPPTGEDFLNEKLSATSYTVVNQRNGRFVRRLCMHCENPTCVSVCPVAALEKTAEGPVIYHADRCMGCRYCMQACPFNVPTYEWNQTQPRIKKCTMCYERVKQGLPTACAEVCPTGATLFGNRDELIEEARARVRTSPTQYLNHIYGLEEVGGTSVLVLTDVPIETLGYPTHVGTEPLPMLTWEVLQKIPNFVVVGSVLLGGIWWITKRRVEVQRAERQEDV